jgi:hypothetical protein
MQALSMKTMSLTFFFVNLWEFFSGSEINMGLVADGIDYIAFPFGMLDFIDTDSVGGLETDPCGL